MEQENEEGGKKVIVAGYTVRPLFFFSEPGERLCIPVLFDTRPVRGTLPLDYILVMFFFIVGY